MKTEVKVTQGGGGIFYTLLIILLLGAITASSIFYKKYQNSKKDIKVLEQTKSALLADTVKFYESKTGQLVAEVQKITLEKNEIDKYSTLIKMDLANMKVKLRDAQMYISTSISNKVKPPDMALRDTNYVDKEKEISAKSFSWHDAWGGMSGIIQNDSLKQPNYYSRDTITAVGVKVYKYKFLGLRFKVIGANLKVKNANPNAQVNTTTYVQLE